MSVKGLSVTRFVLFYSIGYGQALEQYLEPIWFTYLP